MWQRLSLIVLISLLTSCSPTYVAKAGWEEAKILWAKEDIKDLLEDTELEDELRDQLELVQNVRSFAETKNLTPGGSYKEYADIGRDKLVWVLSASEKRALRPLTWWFPVVGSIPYKGFFDKEDAINLAKELETKGYDIYVRHSPAFSTLGWFNDPLLNTMLSMDEISLTNTVIHEILHNTLWISDSAIFNESLANFVGGIGAVEYYAQTSPEKSAQAKDRLHDDILYSQFLGQVKPELVKFYEENQETPLEDLIALRLEYFKNLEERWSQLPAKTDGFRILGKRLNNAVLLAQLVYYANLEQFCKLYYAKGSDLTSFLAALVELKSTLEQRDPFDELSSFLVDSPSECEILD